MTGGTAYLWDPEERMGRLVNPEGVVLGVLTGQDREILHRLLADHVRHTGSDRARALLAGWPACAGDFVRLVPRGREEVAGVPGATVEGEGSAQSPVVV
jgi:glutamate synthase (NADPH/NADH) large chain